MVCLTFLLSSNCKNCRIKTDWSISGTWIGLDAMFPAFFPLTIRDEVFIIRSFIQVVLCAPIWLKGLCHFTLHCLVNSCLNTCNLFILFVRKQRNFLIILEILIRWHTIRLFIRTVLLHFDIKLLGSSNIDVRGSFINTY